MALPPSTRVLSPDKYARDPQRDLDAGSMAHMPGRLLAGLFRIEDAIGVGVGLLREIRDALRANHLEPAAVLESASLPVEISDASVDALAKAVGKAVAKAQKAPAAAE
jgi:hypothetical protein